MASVTLSFAINKHMQLDPGRMTMTMLRYKIPLVFIILSTILLFLGSACTPMPDGNPDDGERWFRMNRCNGCHGEKGSGGIGPNGAKGPVIAGLKLSYRQFKNQLRSPNSAIMPTFEANQLSDKDAADIYLWLQTLNKKS